MQLIKIFLPDYRLKANTQLFHPGGTEDFLGILSMHTGILFMDYSFINYFDAK